MIIAVVIGIVFVAAMFMLKSQAPQPTFFKEVVGKRVWGYGLASKLDYPTVNILTNQRIPGSIYTADSDYGEVIVIAMDRNLCECHYKDWNPEIDKLTYIHLRNVRKAPAPPNSFVEVFNRGSKK